MDNMAAISLEEFYSSTASVDNDQHRIDQAIENIVRRELERDDTACMLSLIGEFVVRATRSLAKLTDTLVAGEHIDENTEDRIQDMDRADQFSNMDYIEYLEGKHVVLRKMNATILQTATQVEYLWNGSPRTPQKPSFQIRETFVPIHPIQMKSCWETERTNMLSPAPTIGKRPASSSPDPDRLEFKYEMKSPRLEDDSQGAINEMIVNYASRGKGRHECPLGNQCRKGGVMPNGDMFVFVRNSAFRAHLEKHGKRYKCKIEGCKNRDGFARKDQLQRHQLETVAHGRPST